MNRSPRWVFAGVLAYLGACVVQTDTISGPKGDDGEPGPPGEAGLPDSSALDVLTAKLDALQAKVDMLEKQAAGQDCPSGYVEVVKLFVSTNSASVLCKKSDDEVVKVGTGGSAFWIDRYEASVWEGTTQRFVSGDDSNVGLSFAKNGQSHSPWVAKSVPAVTPSAFVTWFQAQSACRASGKRLPTGEEWLAAARGTSDPPGDNDGSKNTRCNTRSTSAAGIRKTGSAGDPAKSPQTDGCFSDWGAEDMIGNAWEWTSEWYASVHNLSLTTNGVPVIEPDTTATMPWPDGTYSDDRTWGVLSASYNGFNYARGLPAAARRGGAWGGGAAETGSFAGIFALALNSGPSDSYVDIGFRCILDR